MSEKKTELRGKSWKREREERGRRQLAQIDRPTAAESEPDKQTNESVIENENREQFGNSINSAVSSTEVGKEKGLYHNFVLSKYINIKSNLIIEYFPELCRYVIN